MKPDIQLKHRWRILKKGITIFCLYKRFSALFVGVKKRSTHKTKEEMNLQGVTGEKFKHLLGQLWE